MCADVCVTEKLDAGLAPEGLSDDVTRVLPALVTLILEGHYRPRRLDRLFRVHLSLTFIILTPVDSHRRRLFCDTCMTPMVAIPEGRLIRHTTSSRESLKQPVQGDLYASTHRKPLMTHAQARSGGRQLLKYSRSISSWNYCQSL
jgi:hypothetical protein